MPPKIIMYVEVKFLLTPFNPDGAYKGLPFILLIIEYKKIEKCNAVHVLTIFIYYEINKQKMA